jgi:phospho-N-acetylmuramoyl-pentapeptide-transferase
MLMFMPLSVERGCYLTLLLAVMLTGFFDDASKKPWGNLTKGILDTGIAVLTAASFLYFNENTVHLALVDVTFTIPVWLYGLLIVMLVFGSINVVNCTDGVDGLCGSLSIVTLVSFMALPEIFISADSKNAIVLFIAVLIAYLWFNTKPSTVLMGDAGSRAIGLLVAIVALKSHDPFLFIPFTIVMIFDGGLGLFKLTVLRIAKNVFRIKDPSFMKKIRTPLHDHARKSLKEGSRWEDQQVVWRFLIIQIAVSALTLLFIK